MKVPKISLLLTFVFLIGCGDEKSSGGNPVVPDEPSSSIIAEPESSSSKEQSSSIKESSSSKAKSSSSKDNKHAETSSSGKAKSSSSLARSSSSLKGSSSSAEVSSSSNEEMESSSSSVKTSSSSQKSSSSSAKSSSSKPKSSSSSAKSSSSSEIVVESSSDVIVEESSSSVQSSSSMNSIYDAVNNTLTDLRDNRVYKTVTIGEQIWMAENLNYMPEDTAGTIYSGGTVCGGGSLKSSEDSKKCSIYGRLYTKKIALYKATKSNRQGVCPEGWSIPLKSDWEKLVSFLGDHAAAKLKIADGSWSSVSTNESGFSALIAGTYNYSLKYYTSDSTTAFYHWENNTNPYFFRLYDKSDDASAINYAHGIDMMYSVRCIKD